jgi:ribose-phosphate pyrophosphokinase
VGDLMAVVAGPASARLGADVSELLQVRAIEYNCLRFPDGETQMDLRDSVRGRDVYLVQATCPPVGQHLIELLFLADACRRAGAACLTGVIPYFGYARQERRTERRSLGARVAADIVGVGRFDRLMLIDAHTPSIEGFFDIPIDHHRRAGSGRGRQRALHGRFMVVAPDLGAVKRAREYARLLQVPMAFVHKTRLSGDAVEAHEVMGDVRNRVPVIVDDMLSTGGTVEAAIGALRKAGALEPMTVVVTHALLVGHARDVLRRLPIARLIVGDTVPIEGDSDLHLEVASVAPLIATAIRRNHFDESLADLRIRT